MELISFYTTWKKKKGASGMEWGSGHGANMKL